MPRAAWRSATTRAATSRRAWTSSLLAGRPLPDLLKSKPSLPPSGTGGRDPSRRATARSWINTSRPSSREGPFSPRRPSLRSGPPRRLRDRGRTPPRSRPGRGAQERVSPTVTQKAPKDSYLRELLGNLSVNAPATPRLGEYDARSTFDGLFDSSATRTTVRAPLLAQPARERRDRAGAPYPREPGARTSPSSSTRTPWRSERGDGRSAAAVASAGSSASRTRASLSLAVPSAQLRASTPSRDAIRFALVVADSTSKSASPPTR